MRIDAHHHVWTLARGDYAWLTPNAGPLYRDHEAAELRPLLAEARIDATILVQAAETDAETQHMLDCARRYDWIAGVVGWTDCAAPDSPARIAALAAEPKLVGLRPMLQDMAERDWILRPDVTRGVVALAETGLVFDALIRPDQIPVIAHLADRHPDLVIVIDHAAKPAIGGDISHWAASMRDLARRGNVHVKFSGLLTEAPAGADADILRPVADTLLAAFGAQRLLWGSDWPVLTLAADYARWLVTSDMLLSSLDNAAKAAVFGGNAASLYGILA